DSALHDSRPQLTTFVSRLTTLVLQPPQLYLPLSDPCAPPSMTRSALPLLTLLLPLGIVAGVDRAVPRHATTIVAPADTGRRYTDADVQFMQGMIAHHAQALAMTSLVPTRSTRDVMRLLAQRI